MTESSPYTSLFDLEHLPEKGAERVLKPNPAERTRIAAWLGIESLERLEASVKLGREVSGRYLYRAHFDADVVQACIVTLEPVQSHLAKDFERVFEFVPRAPRHGRRSGKVDASVVVSLADDEDAPERIENPVIDIAAPMLEELSLSLDPYPRKAGVSFTPPEDAPDTAADSPFAVLQKLKRS